MTNVTCLKGGGGGSSISTPLRLRSAQLSLHLGNELTRLFSFLDSPSEKNDKNLGEELVDRFKCLAVAFLGELKIVPHVVVGDTLVNLTKSSVTHNTTQCLCVAGGCDSKGIGPQKRLHVDSSPATKIFIAHLNEASVNVDELQPTVTLGQITKQGVHLWRMNDGHYCVLAF